MVKKGICFVTRYNFFESMVLLCRNRQKLAVQDIWVKVSFQRRKMTNCTFPGLTSVYPFAPLMYCVVYHLTQKGFSIHQHILKLLNQTELQGGVWVDCRLTNCIPKLNVHSIYHSSSSLERSITCILHFLGENIIRVLIIFLLVIVFTF